MWVGRWTGRQTYTFFRSYRIVIALDCSTQILFKMSLYDSQVFTTVAFGLQLSKQAKTIPKCIIVL
jgi:hypothetical protein